MVPPEDITARLRAAGQGDLAALNEVFNLVYEELRRRARMQRRRWSGDDTIDTTALVHETYLKLVDQRHAHWNDRAHFLRVAARAMRHVLVNYAEQRRAAKRGGGVPTVSLEESNPVGEAAAEEVLALHEALERLATVSERQAHVVEAKFFAGLSVEETAHALDVSPRTVKRDWRLACAWLYKEIQTTLSLPAP